MAISRASDSSIQDGLPKYNDIWDGTTATSAFDSLGSVVLRVSTSTSVVFSNIPQTYAHLQLRIMARAASAATGAGEINVRLGTGSESSATVYSRHNIGVYSPTSSTAGLDYNTTATTTQFRGCGQLPLGNDLANLYGPTVLDLLDYANTNKSKTIRSMTGVNDNNNGLCSNIYFTAGSWQVSTAVNYISVFVNGGAAFSANSIFSLYGVK